MKQMATIVVSASRSRRIAKSGGHGEDLAIPAEQMAQTKIITKQIESLEPNAQQLAAESVAWMDRFWDATAGLLWSPGDAPDPHTFDAPIYHLVRDSAWYALGLFLRNRGDDAARAVRILEAVLANQVSSGDDLRLGHLLGWPKRQSSPALWNCAEYGMAAPFDYASLNYSEAPLRVLRVTLRNS